MHKLNSFKNSSIEKTHINEENQSQKQKEKILCNHCGRTVNNGIRCLGMCVADDDY